MCFPYLVHIGEFPRVAPPTPASRSWPRVEKFGRHFGYTRSSLLLGTVNASVGRKDMYMSSPSPPKGQASAINVSLELQLQLATSIQDTVTHVAVALLLVLFL